MQTLRWIEVFSDVVWPYLFHATWQSMLVGVLVLGLVWLLRNRSASLRYTLLVLALVKFAVPPLVAVSIDLSRRTPAEAPAGTVSASLPKEPSPAPALDTGTVSVEGPRMSVPVAPSHEAPPQQPVTVQTAAIESVKPVTPRYHLAWHTKLVALHLTGALVMSLWILGWMLRIGSLKRRARMVTSGPLYEQFMSLCAALDLNRRVDLFISGEKTSPIAFGLFRPKVLIPTSMVEELPAEHLGGILAHELAHVRRWDLWAIALENALSLLWWFNPVFWMVGRALRRTREDCCDDLVLHLGLADNSVYCESLVRAASSIAGFGRLHPAVGTAEMLHPLGRRMKRVMDRAASRSPRLSIAGTAIVLILGTVMLPGLRPVAVAGDEASVSLVGSATRVPAKSPSLVPAEDTGPHRLYTAALDQEGKTAASIADREPDQVARRVPEGAPLEILSAKYGALDKWVDVTPELRSRVRDGRLAIRASNGLAGDPIYGAVKSLKVEYRVGDQTRVATVTEGDELRLPQVAAEKADAPAPSDAMSAKPDGAEETPTPSGPLEILSARYGAGDTWVDVKDLLQQRVKNGELAVKVSNRLAGDPIPGTAKKLEVHYSLGGMSGDVSVAECEMLRIPSGAWGDASAHLSGRVVDTKGSPVPNARLELYPTDIDSEAPDEFLWNIRTDHEGRFEYEHGLPGKYWLVICHGHGCRQLALEQPLVVDAREAPTSREVVVHPAGEFVISGVVVDGVGNPVPRVVADSFIPHDQHWIGTTDAEGKFRLLGLDGIGRDPLDIYFNNAPNPAYASQYKLVYRNVPVGTTGLRLVLEEPGRIEGRFLDKNGQPAVFEKVTVPHITFGDPSRVLFEPPVEISYDSGTGQFQIGNVAPGRVCVSFHVEGERQQWAETDVSAGEAVTLTVHAEEPCVLEGRLTISDTRAPVRQCGFEVWRTNPDQGMGWYESDETGLYRVDTLPAGNYVVRPLHQRRGEWFRSYDVTLVPGTTSHQDFSIGGTGTIKCTVTYPDHFWFAKLMLRELGLDFRPDPWADRPTVSDRALTVYHVSAPGEECTLINVPTGTWELVAFGCPSCRYINYEARRYSAQVVTIKEGETLDLDIDLGAGTSPALVSVVARPVSESKPGPSAGDAAVAPSFSARLVDTNGEPFANAHVYLHPAIGHPNSGSQDRTGMPMRNTETDAEGKFAFDAVNPGVYTLQFYWRDAEDEGNLYLDAQKFWLDVSSSNATTELSIVVPSLSSHSVGGCVRDTQGNPVAGVTVDAKGYADYSRSSTTADSEGRYLIRGIAGDVAEMIWFKGAGKAELKNVGIGTTDADVTLR